MDVVSDSKLPEVPVKIRKKPLASIVSLVLERYVGYYLVDKDGNEMSINEAYWGSNSR